MRRNEGPIDRGIRAALGVVAIVGGVVVGGAPAVLLYVVGAVLLGTAAVGWCPLYRVLSISTCPAPRQRSQG